MPATKRYLPDLMTATEIADLLGRTKSWWSQLVSAGVVTPVDRAGPRGSARYRLVDAVLVGRERGCDMEAVELRVPPSVMAVVNEESAPKTEEQEAWGDVPDLQEERALHERRKRELTKIKLAAARAELLPADTVRDVYGSVGAMVREKVMAIEISAVTHLDEHGLSWLREELRSVLTQIVRDAERMSEPLYERQIEDDGDA